jgi:hypothetical protein
MNHIEITKTEICYCESIKSHGNFHYTSTEIADVWPYLRKPCVIANGVTWEDLLIVISENNSLKTFVEKCYPHYSFIPPSDVIARNVFIKDYNFKIKPVLSLSSSDKPLILKDEIKLKNNDRTPLPASMKWSLLEILDILFSEAKSQFSCFLSCDGLKNKNYKLIPPDDIMTCLMSKCKVTTKTTLGDIIKFVSSNKMLETFISKYSSCDVSALHKSAKTKPKKLSNKIYLQINSHGELFNGKFFILNQFYGVGNMLQLGEETPRTEQHSITTTPINELVHIPVIANNKFVIRFTKNYKIFTDCFKELTLLNILDAIYWDIGILQFPLKRGAADKD